MKAWTATLERFVVQTLLGLPVSLQTRLSGQPPIEIDGLTLHPEIQLLLAAWRWRGGQPLRAGSPELARRRFRAEALRFPLACPVDHVRDFTIEAATGTLAVRHYSPGAASGSPLLVFFHGGGFVLGDLDTHDALCRLLCKHASMHVLAVEYRLAPEHPFPRAFEDSVAAFGWAMRHAEQLGADSSRVCVGGDSAGGNLSAGVAQHALRAESRAPAAQLLIYPHLDAVEAARSAQLFASGFVLEQKDSVWFTRNYVPEGVDRSDVRLSPLRVADPAGLCPAFIVTSGFDPLRDEGEAYARKLAAAGVLVALRRYDGFVHGFGNMVGVSPAARSIVIEMATAFGAFVRGADPVGALPLSARANRF
jgi:acetyl esterase